MGERTFTEGDIVLAEVEPGTPASVKILEVWEAGTLVPYDRLWVQVLGVKVKCAVPVDQVAGPCDARSGCTTGDDTCVHCHAHVADPHQPGCPHEFADDPEDECEGAPSELDEVAEAGSAEQTKLPW